MKWISVQERLPKDCDTVLLHKKGLYPITGYLMYTQKNEPLCYVLNDWDEYEVHFRLNEITHWMELPESPNEVD